MSKAVVDLGRVLVTEMAGSAIEIEAKARKRDKQEIVREALDAWARERHIAYRLFAKHAAAKGFQMELDVGDLEDDGARRK